MSGDQLIGEYEIPNGAQRGARLTLYANRLVQQDSNATETVPLAHLASVRVAFERDARKLNWAIVLLVLALALTMVSGPLQRWIAGAVAKFSDPARPESLDAVLLGVFKAIGALASLLPGTASALTVIAVLLVVLFWFGATTLTLAFAASERSCTVRGRDTGMFEFADQLSEQLAAWKD